MADNLYIATLEPYSGKLVITLGIMEMLSCRINRLGFFRTISPVAAEEDSHIQLIASQFNLSLQPEQMVGVTYDQAKAWIATGEEQRLLREIVQRFKAAEILRLRDVVDLTMFCYRIKNTSAVIWRSWEVLTVLFLQVVSGKTPPWSEK